MIPGGHVKDGWECGPVVLAASAENRREQGSDDCLEELYFHLSALFKPSTYLILELELLTSATLEGHCWLLHPTGRLLQELRAPSRSPLSYTPPSSPSPPHKSPTGWLGRNPAQHPAATHMSSLSLQPPQPLQVLPSRGPPRPPTGPSPGVLNVHPLPCSLISAMPEPALSGFHLFPPVIVANSLHYTAETNTTS